MKRIVCPAIFACMFLPALFSLCWAIDFMNMSNDQLFELRPATKFMTDDERKAYYEEWEKRVAGMTEEEKKQFEKKPKENGEIKWLWSPGQGYENQQTQGSLIYGGGSKAMDATKKEQK